MLDLIVLGQIPGTNIQITFSLFGLVMIVLLSVAFIHIRHKNLRDLKDTMKRRFEIITLSNLDQQA